MTRGAEDSSARALSSLHLPGELDRGANGSSRGSVKIRLDFVMSLESRWHAETRRVGGEERLPFAERYPNEQRGWVKKTSDQTVADVPRWMFRIALAPHQRQRLEECADLFEGHARTVRGSLAGPLSALLDSSQASNYRPASSTPIDRHHET
jgi:hypothetical protein